MFGMFTLFFMSSATTLRTIFLAVAGVVVCLSAFAIITKNDDKQTGLPNYYNATFFLCSIRGIVILGLLFSLYCLKLLIFPF